MNDVFTFTITIPDFSSLLLWLMLLCFLGCCVTLWPMLVMSRFFLRKDGTRFSILLFQLPFSISKFQSLVNNITGRTKDTVRMNLKLDYYFMPFVYLLLLFGGWYVLHLQQFSFAESNYYKLLFLPLLAWVFDILENKTALASIKLVTKTKTRTLFVFALIKWILIIGYLGFMVAIALNILNRR
jgi:hypothetical protein